MFALFESIPRPTKQYVRGARGLQKVKGVAKDSTTTSLRSPRDRDRADSVPLHPHRQAPAETQTEVRLIFEQPPSSVQRRQATDPTSSGEARPHNRIRSSSTPSGRGMSEAINLDMEFAEQGEGDAYEVLLHAAMMAKHPLARQVEEAGESCRLIAKPRMHPYKPGSWGPNAADKLVKDYGGWHGPWITP